MSTEILSARAQLAMDTLLQKPVKGIPASMVFLMEHAHIERIAGAEPGAYVQRPEETYLACMKKMPVCLIDQYIPLNPLSMGSHGYEDETERGATTGAHDVVLDGLIIDSPETVVEHMERFVFPELQQALAAFEEDECVKLILDGEAAIQAIVAPEMLKSGYGFIRFPGLAYGYYGYVNYFMAIALYPEVFERHFALQADLNYKQNVAAARAYREGGLPPLYRLDHDMADSRGMLVNIKLLDKIWLPHFARALEPMLRTDVKMIWHCDGNLMDMVPRLLEVGVKGFQGFQYEDGMDYEAICRMKAKDGDDLIIWGGVSVTRTLPMGTPADVKREIDWLVANGPKTGLFLSGSSSITPGVRWENIETMLEGLRYYQEHGRG